MPRRAGVPIAVLLALLVASCGFQLRGHFTLPPQMATTVIEGVDTREGFGRELADMLRANGVEVATGRGEGVTVITVTGVSRTSRLLALGSVTTLREYELMLTVAFRAASGDGTLAVDDQHIAVTRSHTHDTADVLGSRHSEDVMVAEMNREAARLVLYRLAAAARR